MRRPTGSRRAPGTPFLAEGEDEGQQQRGLPGGGHGAQVPDGGQPVRGRLGGGAPAYERQKIDASWFGDVTRLHGEEGLRKTKHIPAMDFQLSGPWHPTGISTSARRNRVQFTGMDRFCGRSLMGDSNDFRTREPARWEGHLLADAVGGEGDQDPGLARGADPRHEVRVRHPVEAAAAPPRRGLRIGCLGVSAGR